MEQTISIQDKVSPEVAEKLLSLQKRCIVCGSAYPLHIHHRFFRSEGSAVLKKFLVTLALPLFKLCYRRELPVWGLHDIQNLCVLCIRHHEGNVVGVHGGNEKLRQQLRNSYTCPQTGFNIPFVKNFQHD